MSISLPKGGRAVMATRKEPPDSLEFFPTPPWGTRVLLEIVLERCDWLGCTAWDGCAGEGHMAEVLKEYFREVYASDVFDYGRGYEVGSFIGQGLDVARCPFAPDWVIMNPPFGPSVGFLRRALREAKTGVALLCRSAWSESQGRYESVFRDTPPAIEALFVERLPMHKGRWEPDGDTMTAYSWFVWRAPFGRCDTRKMWIPPGQRRALEHADDRRRFAKPDKDDAQEELLPCSKP